VPGGDTGADGYRGAGAGAGAGVEMSSIQIRSMGDVDSAIVAVRARAERPPVFSRRPLSVCFCNPALPFADSALGSAAAAQERQREAAHIASAAVEVNEAFKDLGGLVVAQGETLAAVEATVDTSRDTVVRANKDLVLAASYQRSYRKKCCIFWLLLVAVAVAIIVPVVLHFNPLQH
jgi:hypothetical protein